MKRKLFSIFAIMLAMTLILSMTVSAAERLSDFDTTKTPIMKGTPTIDGEKDDMYNYSLEFNRPYLYHYTEEGGNLEPGAFTEEQYGVTMNATGSLLWDENNVYLFVEVTGDELYASGDDTLSYWSQGSGVIIMYYPGDAGGNNEMYYKLRVANGAETYNASASNTDGDYPDDAAYAYKKTADGWNLEIQMKLATAVKQGDPFQFALQTCSVSPNKNLGFAHVNENFNQITFPFTLGGPVVVPEPEPEPEPVAVEAPVEAAPAPVEPAAVVAPAPVVPQTGDGIMIMVPVAIIAIFGTAVLFKKRKI